MSEEGSLTVAEAAASLGVSVRTLRRLLSEARFSGRTEAIERHTAKGPRITAMLPPDLLTDLRAHLHRGVQGQAKAGNGGEAQAASEASEGTLPNAPPDGAEAATLPALAYQRVIAALEAQNADLRADKERLYEALQLAQENLKREQSLRLIGVERAELSGAASAQGEAPGSPETDADTSVGAETSGAGAGKTAEGQTTPIGVKTAGKAKQPGWWARLWGAAND